MSKVTIKEIAKICGVGVSTVSRAMNNHPDINPETKEMIMRTIDKYQYVPNNSARNLKRTESKTIALLIKGIANPFFLSMLKTFEAKIVAEGYDYVIHHVNEEQNEIDIALSLEKEKRLIGIIFLGASFLNTEEHIKQLTTPSVFCTLASIENVSENVYSSVAIDDFRESYTMTKYLIDLGHRKIALLGGREHDISIGRLRLEGYKKALEDGGIIYDKNLVFYMKEDLVPYSIENGYEIMKDTIKEEKDFTAVFALCDEMAIGAIKALNEVGKKVPEDYSVAGFDGTKHAFFYNPSLTTIVQPSDEMISKSADILFDMIEGNKDAKHVVLEAKLRVGESTAKLN